MKRVRGLSVASRSAAVSCVVSVPAATKPLVNMRIRIFVYLERNIQMPLYIRDTEAAKRLLTRLLEKQGCPPRRMITDKLGSYAAARRQIMPAIEHRSRHRGDPERRGRAG